MVGAVGVKTGMLKSKIKNTMDRKSIKISFGGFPFYEELPAGFTVAKPEDFYVDVPQYDANDQFTGYQTQLRKQIAFLVKSFHSEIYWAERTKESFNPSEMKPWFDAGHVFINTD